jgi:hypothetical protein
MTKNRKLSQFKATLRVTTSQLDKELWNLSAKNPVMQIAMNESDFRNDGFPRAQAKAEHPGIILSLDTAHGALSFPCDTFTTWQDNLRAVVLTMEKLRAIDRYGVTKNDQQYKGWLAIEATAAPAGFATVKEALEFLADVSGHSSPRADPDTLRTMLRKAQRATHPDVTGADSYRFERVSAAEALLRAEGRI